MFDLLVVEIHQPLHDLLRVVPDGRLVLWAILGQNVSETGLHLLKVDTEELVDQLTPEELHDVLVLQLLVFFDLVLEAELG